MSLPTQEQIVAELQRPLPLDLFGWRAEVLVGALDFEHAKPFLKDGVTADQWPGPVEDLQTEAVDYVRFAFEKASGHRGISAERSVMKMGAYLWLLGLDVNRFEAAGYENYGAPKLFVAAELLGVTPPADEGLGRMAQGLPCRTGCMEGCGS